MTKSPRDISGQGIEPFLHVFRLRLQMQLKQANEPTSTRAGGQAVRSDCASRRSSVDHLLSFALSFLELFNGGLSRLDEVLEPRHSW